jgi:group II intron reverse transcriptase/maturase
MTKVLEAIYEPLFYSCSFGFRRGIGCHDALRALSQYLYRSPVSTVIDVDLANFFGSIKPRVLETIIREKIGDARFVRYILRMLRAGVLADGELQVSDEGVPQGAPISPVLANVVAHHVIDEWFEGTVRQHCGAPVALFRYCDDLVICCASERDAARIRVALERRLQKFGLSLNAEKTRCVAFSKARARRGQRQGTFDFLGFTFYMGKSLRGHYTPRLRTSRKRIRSKLKRVKDWASRIRSRVRLGDLWRTFRQKIAGHIGYYAVSFNVDCVAEFVRRATFTLFSWLNRRGSRRRIRWEDFLRFWKANPLPRVVVKHNLFTSS